MKIFNFIKRYKSYILILFFIAVYFYSMVIFPFYKSKYDFDYLLEVWFAWQTLNAAMIALLASAIAIYSTVYTQKKNKESNLIAAKARLPFALSNLMSYSEKICNHYKPQYENMKKGGKFNRNFINLDNISFDNSSVEIITECIKHADKFEARHLSKILNDFQVLNSRLQGYFSSNVHRLILLPNVKGELLSIAEIIHAIEGSYDYARGEDKIQYAIPEAKEKEKILFFRCRIEI